MDKKQIILASILTLSAIFIAWALYFFFFRKPPAPEIVEPTPGVEAPALPQAGEAQPGEVVVEVSPELPAFAEPSAIAAGGITQTTTVVENRTKGVVPSKSGLALNLYDANEGRFYEVSPDGSRQLMTNETFFNVSSVAWSPDRTRAVLEYPDGFNTIYDFTLERQITLPTHWEQFEFSKDGNQISSISKGIHSSQNWLVVANADGTQARGIEPLGDNADKVIPTWNPGGEIVAFSQTGDPVGGEANEIYLIGQNNENFRSLIVDGYGFEPNWSQAGDQLLYSTHSSFNDYKPLIWVVDAAGSEVGANRRELGVSTWAHKCTFNEATSVICAVPNELPEGAGFNPDVAVSTPDTFYKIDTITGLKTQLAIPEVPVNATDLQVSTDGAYLFYKNTFNEEVQKIQLK